MNCLELNVFDVLYLAKQMYEHDYREEFFALCGNHELDGDLWYEISWEAISCVMGDFSEYDNEEQGISTLVFFDPLIEELYQLIGQYEKETGETDMTDPFRRNAERDIYNCLCFEAYDYGVALYDGSHGRPRLVVLYGEEFCGMAELPGALMDVCDQLNYHISLLRRELGLNWENETEKEAA